MKQHLILAVLTGSLIASPALGQAVPPPTISVSGEGNVSVPPDIAMIDGGVSTEAKTAREASESNNAAMGKVLLALKAGGLDEKDVQTSRLSLQPQYAAALSSRPASGGTIIGYRASNRVTIRLRDVTKVAATIDTLVSSGANDIGGINFMVEKASKLLDDARTEAIADARRKAEIYAKAAGVTLGAPVSIAEEGVPAQMPFRKMMAAAAPTPIAQGEETLQVSVAVSWAIKTAASPEPLPPVPPAPIPNAPKAE